MWRGSRTILVKGREGIRQFSISNPILNPTSDPLHGAPIPQLSPAEDLQKIISSFDAPIKFAMAYGSGAFPQKGYEKIDKKDVMIDFIFGVTHPQHWHDINIRYNPHHYSFLKYLGSGVVTLVQRRGAGVYFNTLVEIEGKLIKYGVVAIDTLDHELRNWDNFYLSGRLQKPVAILREDARIKLGNKVNMQNAVRTALLLLPENFTEHEIFSKIVSLSYTGDFRMKFGENPKKIENIVEGQKVQLKIIYEEVFQQTSNLARIDGEKYQQNMDPKVRTLLLNNLPGSFQSRIENHYFLHGQEISNVKDPAQLREAIVRSPQIPFFVEKALTEIIQTSSRVQSLKGILTAGFTKSFRYVGMKLGKRN